MTSKTIQPFGFRNEKKLSLNKSKVDKFFGVEPRITLEKVTDTLYIEEEEQPFQNLRELYVKSDSIYILNPKIGNLRALRTLDLSNNYLKSLPAEIGELKSLRILDISCNELESLPAEIGKLSSLVHLNIHLIHLKSLPAEIGKLSSLMHLNLSNNYLKSLPTEIGKLSSLMHLDIGGNRLESFPAEICELSSLVHLDISWNRFESLPAEIGKLSSLIYLEIIGNNLESLPAEIGKLSSLSSLHGGYNRLTMLPDEFWNLRKLHTLSLTENRLEFISPEIRNLQELNYISICHNRLTTLPNCIGELPRLNSLFFSDNEIEFIPPSIRRFLDRQLHHQGVYTDAQNVHNSSIQQSIKDSISRIIDALKSLTVDIVYNQIASDKILTKETKRLIFKFATCKDTICDVTFEQVLTAVWNRIVSNKHAVGIKEVLNQEITDAEGKCFTGRVSRLVNCLNGYDELVEVKIADNEQIGNVIAATRNALENTNSYTAAKHKYDASVALRELGYTESVIDEWVSEIE
jgi:Leucine-rich repeat (LRR) protein